MEDQTVMVQTEKQRIPRGRGGGRKARFIPKPGESVIVEIIDRLVPRLPTTVRVVDNGPLEIVFLTADGVTVKIKKESQP